MVSGCLKTEGGRKPRCGNPANSNKKRRRRKVASPLLMKSPRVRVAQ